MHVACDIRFGFRQRILRNWRLPENLGPGLGDVAFSYQALTPASKWLLVIAMLLGRLEIFTLLVLLTPDYWRS
ncbi:MAG: hypothetical protein Ct9H300mP8_09390 [Gammaproteobacteria bacterium]|nr:MAG: hypothetical protein Ct9H300mP8_09390 [Gammaproteobacteria bacterium]